MLTSEEQRAKRAVRNRAYYQRNRAHISQKMKQWRQNNYEKYRAGNREWERLNPERVRLNKRNFNITHRAEHKHRNALRRTALRNSTPPWVDKSELLRIYRACPPGMVVDHIIPLKGNGVSGLHVPWNLQYLTAVDNLQKGNKFPTFLQVA
jgi:5-methylcytosine-specific restriction endonuclease McrA